MEGNLIVAAFDRELDRIDNAADEAGSRNDTRARMTLNIQRWQLAAAMYRAMAAYGVDQQGKNIPVDEMAEVVGTAEGFDRQAIWAQREFNAVFLGGRHPGDPSLGELAFQICDQLGVGEGARVHEKIAFWLFDRCPTGQETAESLAAEWRHMHGDYSKEPVL